MTIEAELHDGTILEFPDTTPNHVIQSAVRKHLGSGATQQGALTEAGMRQAARFTPAEQTENRVRETSDVARAELEAAIASAPHATARSALTNAYRSDFGSESPASRQPASPREEGGATKPPMPVFDLGALSALGASSPEPKPVATPATPRPRGALDEPARMSVTRGGQPVLQNPVDELRLDGPALAEMHADRSQFSKGLDTGVTGAKQMAAALGTVPVQSALKTLGEQLGGFDQIDRGERPQAMQGPGFVPDNLRAYSGAAPEERQRMRAETAQRLEKYGGARDTLLRAWSGYQSEMKKSQGRVPNFTDINDVEGFKDWFAFNIGQGIPYMTTSALSGIIGGVVGGPAGATAGVLASGGAMGMGDIQSAMIEKVGPENTGPAIFGAVPYAALDMLGPVGRVVRQSFRGVSKDALSDVAKSYFKRAGKEIPANAVEEFINEAGQEIIKDAAVATVTGERVVTDESLKNWFNAGMAGAATGAPMGALTAAANGPQAGSPATATTPAVDAFVANKPATRALVTSPTVQAKPGSPWAQPQGAVQGAMGAQPTPAATAQPTSPAQPAATAVMASAEDVGLSDSGEPVAESVSSVPVEPAAESVAPGDGTRAAPVVVTAPEHLEQAEQQVNTEPTDAQKEAGNYAKAHVQFQGFDISIENPKGSERTGVDADGKPWSTVMPNSYGYLKRSTGADGDQVDVYLGDKVDAKTVFVVDQIDPETGAFDEHKALLGQPSIYVARQTYEAGFSDGKGKQRIGAITTMPVEKFREWVKSGDTTKPLRYQAPPPPAPVDPDAREQAKRFLGRAAAMRSKSGKPIEEFKGSGQMGTWKIRADVAKGTVTATKGDVTHSFAAKDLLSTVAEENAKAGAGPKKTSGGRLSPISDDRLTDPEYEGAVRALAQGAGWDEKGGRLIRDEADPMQPVIGRTSWAASEWWQQRPFDARLPGDTDGAATREAVRKAVAGEPLGATEKRAVRYMLDRVGTEIEDARLSAEERRAEQEAKDAADSGIDDLPQDEQDGAIDFGFDARGEVAASDWDSLSEAEREAELDDIFGPTTAQRQGGKAVARGETGGAQADEDPARPQGQGGQGEVTPTAPQQTLSPEGVSASAPLELTGQSPAEVAAEAAKQAAQAAQAVAESVKAAADAMRDAFVLSGSARAADEAAARGQQDLLGDETPNLTEDEAATPAAQPDLESAPRETQAPASPAAADVASVSADEFEQLLGQVQQERNEGKPAPRVRKPRDTSTAASRKPSERAPKDAATTSLKTAGKHAATGVKEGFAGLDALFGRKGTLGSGPVFDEDTWAKAKPHFEAAFNEFVQAGRSLKEFIRHILDTYNDAITPYLRRWHQDKLREAENADERSGAAAESDRPTVQDEVGAGDVRSESGGAGDGRGSSLQGSDSQGGPAGSERVRDGDAVAPGEPGDQPIRGEDTTPGSPVGPAGNHNAQRGGDTSLDGVQADLLGANRPPETAAGRPSLVEKIAAQKRAESVPVRVGEIGNIREALPFLLEGQQDDVAFAERRFALGQGVMFTNGTGTGKTLTGLGVVKRFARQGKPNTIVVAPTDKIADDWVKSAAWLGLNASMLPDTRSAGTGLVVTTYANFGQNEALFSRDWDLVITDESHYLMNNKEGAASSALDRMRLLTRHRDSRWAYPRAKHPAEWSALQNAAAMLKALRSDQGSDNRLLAKAEAAEEQARETWKKLSDSALAEFDAIKPEQKPRVAFLSATPFAYHFNVDYAEGYLFDFTGEQRAGYNQPSPRDAFYIQHFGYRMRTGKLNKPDANVDVGLMEIQFNGWLKREGSLSSRMLDVEADYDRRFIMVDDAIGTKIDEGMEFLREAHGGRLSPLYDQMREGFTYHNRMYLLEALKARHAVTMIREHLAGGRKVVVFHDFLKGGGFHPFRFSKRSDNMEMSVSVRGEDGKYKSEMVKWNDLVEMFNKERADLVGLNFDGIGSPINVLTSAFPDALLFNGTVPKQKRRDNVAKFNDDGGRHNLLIVQSDAGREGISLHDTTGKYQRALINLGMPVRPTSAIQIEGRIYRTGQVSNAMFRYLNTGTNYERWTFASKIAERAGTAENLAMGDDARALKETFIEAFEDSGLEPTDGTQGTGGKSRDRVRREALTPFQRAKTFYSGNQKRNSKTKSAEGADYFATPEPLGLKMVEWADIRHGDRMLEPSAGHAAIGRWFPQGDSTLIEPSYELVGRAKLAAPDSRLLNERFEDHDIVNKYDVIVMNPPFGQGGSTAIAHLAKAARHLNDGGRIVALLPEGPAADKRLEKFLYGTETRPVRPAATWNDKPVYRGDIVTGTSAWTTGTVTRGTTDGVFVQREGVSGATLVPLSQIKSVESKGARTEEASLSKDLHLVTDIGLPSVTFERAGTGVKTHVIVLEKQTQPERAAQIVQRSRRDIEADDINEMFDAIENVEMRPRVTAQAAAKPAATSARPAAQPTVGAPAASATPQDVTYETDAPEVEYTTKKGKTIFGVIAKDLTLEQAKAIDPFTWKKDGGYFIRAKHVKRKGSDQAPSFRRSDAPNPAVSVANVHKALGDTPSRFSVPTRVYATAAEASRELGFEMPSDILGVHYKGQISLIAENLKTPEAVEFTLWHEAFHAGADAIERSDGFNAFADALRRVAMSNPNVRRAAFVWREKYGSDEADMLRQFGVSEADIPNKVLLKSWEEAIADISGNNPNLRNIDRLVAALQTLLRKLGFNRLAGMIDRMEGKTNADALQLIRRARDAITPEGAMVLRGDAAPAMAREVDAAATDDDAAPPAFSRGRPSGDPILDEARQRAGITRDNRNIFERSADYLKQGRQQIAADIGDTWDAMTQGGLDRFYGIKRAQKQLLGNLPAEQDAYVAARLSTGIQSLMRGILQYGAPEWRDGIISRRANSKGLLDVLAPVRDDFDDWIGWMVGKRAERLKAEGKENNLTDDHIKKLIAQAAGKEALFQDTAREFARFKRSILDVAEGSGLIDKATRPMWDQSDWIPFYRVTEGPNALGPKNRRGLAGQTSGIRTLKGGSSAINDPLENILMNFAHLLDASLKNHAVRLVAQNMGGSGVLERVGMKVGAALIPLNQIPKIMEAQGVPPQIIAQIPRGALQGIQKMWSIQAPTDKDVIRVMVDGKAEYYRVLDPLLLRSLTAMHEGALGGIMTPLRWTKRLLTHAVTATPEFIARNFIRDALQAWTINKDGFKPGIDSVRGAVKSLKEEGGMLDMMFAGGSFMGGYANGNDPKAMAVATRAALREKGWKTASINQFMSTLIDSPAKLWEAWQRIGAAAENANREAVYEAAIKAGKPRAQAVYEAKDLMDYSMQGDADVFRVMADIIPFFNARLQGLYKLGRAGVENPKTIMIRGLILTAASLALMGLNWDRPEYDELEEWDKDTYWHFWIAGQHFRMPKPFEIGVVFGTIPERMARALGKKEDYKLFLKRLWWNFSQNAMILEWPQAVKPMLEVWGNRSTFNQRPIESQGDEQKLPEARYSQTTSDTVRSLVDLMPEAANATGMSPKRLEHLWRGYLGELGMYALGLSDIAVRALNDAPPRPSMRMDDVPLIKAFYRESPPRSTKFVTEFYELYREVDDIHRTIAAYEKQGLDERADALEEKNATKLDERKSLSREARRIADIRKEVEEIYRDREMSKDEKRKQIDELTAERNAIAETAVRESKPAFR